MPNPTDIKLIKFTNGEEILAGIIEDRPDTVKFDIPIRLFILPPMRGDTDPKPRLGFDQYLPYVESREFTVDKSQILFMMKPIKQLIDTYLESREVLAPSSLITPRKPKLIITQ